ncbi:MAG: transporter substrate-binding domain-containing protein [Atopobium sp.]|jgi:ABC-type amino acid transport substrate-binding protein|nr:transporter substrate-binding domain-containing protein [Atopobium sp.]
MKTQHGTDDHQNHIIPAKIEIRQARRLSRRSFLGLSGAAAAGMGLTVLLGGCGSASTTASGSTDSGSSTTAAKTYRVGMECAYSPWNWQTSESSDYAIPIDNVSGAYADGYDIQIAKVVAKALGGDAVAEKMAFSGLIDALNNDQIDLIIAGMVPTDERKQSIDFSEDYKESGYTLLVKSSGPYANATSLSDFSGATVLGQVNTMLDTIIDDIPNVIHATPVDSTPSMVSNLENGTCDAITAGKDDCVALIKANPDLMQVNFADGEGFQEVVGVAVGLKKGQDDELNTINEALDSLSDDDRQSIWDACVERAPE